MNDRRISLADFHPNNIFGFPENFFSDNSEQKYPPVNVLVSPNQDEVRIEMAVAGFTPDDISIEEEDNRLIVSGKSSRALEEGWKYESRNFALREFRRMWVKKASFIVDSATQQDGVLTITLKKNGENVRKIPILSS